MASTSATVPSAMTESPNWLEMPHDLMENILQRVGTEEIFKSSRKVCTTWRRICKDPAMWKVIVMRRSFDRLDEWNTDYVLEKLTKWAVDLSCGELIDISFEYFCNDDLLDHIVLRSSKLKHLRLRLCGIRGNPPPAPLSSIPFSLRCCLFVTGSGLTRAVKRLPQLETLDLSFTSIKPEDIEFIGQNCPQLKSFKMEKSSGLSYINCDCDDHALAIANNMPELRHLEVHDEEMTNDGLEAILNGCPHLQSLDVRGCRNLYLGGKLGKLCMECVKDFKHTSYI